jgi:hypothetical protein
MKKRPLIFVGSSTEGLKYAKALQQNLDHTMEVVLWSQGVFGLSGGTLESLVEKLESVDFAALVVTPDDLIYSRGTTQPAPRDNVLLELGMCIGTLGRERSFLVFDRTSEIKLPSDLAGITPATFQPHTDGNAQAALGAACTQIEQKAIELGLRVKQGQVGLIDENSQFRIVADLLGVVADNYIIQMLLSGTKLKREVSRFMRLGNYWYGIDFPGRHIGNGRFSVDELCEKLIEADIVIQNLRFEVGLTERGKNFARWLIDNGYKAEAFQCPIGGWGVLSKINQHGIEYFKTESKNGDEA